MTKKTENKTVAAKAKTKSKAEKAVEKKPVTSAGVTTDTSASDRTEYQQNYWLTNKAKISAKRKERYKTDPKYRAQHLEQTKKSRKRKREKEATGKLKRDIELSEKRHKGKPLPEPRLMRINGTPTACYSTTALARYIARSNETIRRWFTKGVMLGVSYVDDGGDYWFTKKFCDAMRSCIEEMYHLPRQRKGEHGDTAVLKDLIVKKFKEEKIPYKKVR